MATHTSDSSANRSVVGVSTPRNDGPEKVTGGAIYTADVELPGTLWAKTLRSPFARARIVSIDTTRAEKLPGVRAVLTGKDVAGCLYGRGVVDVPLLAHEEVRFVGEQLAAVAADEEEIARRAIELIDVAYEELPPLLDAEKAMEANAPLLHPDVASYRGLPIPLEGPTNVFSRMIYGGGDVDAGLAGAEMVLESTFTVPAQHQAYMEPHCCLVWIDDAYERVHVWAPNKMPYNTKAQVAAAVGIEADRILMHPITIGGDFGGKASPMNIPLCYFLAKATGKPVRSVFTYTEEFMAANPRHPAVVHLRTGFSRDGTFAANDARVIYNSGAYGGFKPLGFLPNAAGASGSYRFHQDRIVASIVYTNNVPCGYMRAPGGPQVVFAIESQVDLIAKLLGMDPVELRLKNLITDDDSASIGAFGGMSEGDPIFQAFSRSHVEIRAKETLEAAVRAADYYAPKPPNVGRGVAISDHAPGGGEAHAIVTLTEDGSVIVGTPVFEPGSGVYTMLQQVVAERFGLPASRVTVEVMDTDGVPYDSGVAASRTTRLSSQAADGAAVSAKEELVKLAAELLGWPIEQIEVRGDLILSGATGVTQPWAPLIARTGEPAVGRADIIDTEASPVTGFTAQVAEVQVDPETGNVTLLKLTTAHDTGRIMNPQGHQGQINGGIQQGLGYGLMEHLEVEDGRVTTLSFADYKVPTFADMPELVTVLLESDSGIGPHKVKGIGENPSAPTAAAIANAVADATGIRLYELPVTSERVLRRLAERDADGKSDIHQGE
jgi:CO/xanthine dehydrogenase Mo-binding subunit